MKAISSLSLYNAKEAIEFYKTVFKARVNGTVLMMNDIPGYEDKVEYNNLIAHADITIGETTFFIADQLPDNIQEVGRNIQICINLYDEKQFNEVYKTMKARATIEREIEAEYWGSHSFSVKDPYDIVWHIFLLNEKTE